VERRVFLVLFVVACVAGAFLRLDGVSHELIVSDEWHGLHAAALVGYGELFSLMTPGATSIPLNLYYKALLDTVGWSEFGLRLPSLLAGIAALVVLPLVSRPWLGLRARATFSALLAISPMLVFYSRYSRPYALVVLLTFVGLVACHTWWQTGRARYAHVF
jgi:predicted membrane-bound mannosyltransferase